MKRADYKILIKFPTGRLSDEEFLKLINERLKGVFEFGTEIEISSLGPKTFYDFKSYLMAKLTN